MFRADPKYGPVCSTRKIKSTFIRPRPQFEHLKNQIWSRCHKSGKSFSWGGTCQYSWMQYICFCLLLSDLPEASSHRNNLRRNLSNLNLKFNTFFKKVSTLSWMFYFCHLHKDFFKKIIKSRLFKFTPTLIFSSWYLQYL